MDKVIVVYILIGLVAYFVLHTAFGIVAYLYKQSFERRRLKKETRAKEKAKWKYSHVTPGNPLMQKITQSRTKMARTQYRKHNNANIYPHKRKIRIPIHK